MTVIEIACSMIVEFRDAQDQIEIEKQKELYNFITTSGIFFALLNQVYF